MDEEIISSQDEKNKSNLDEIILFYHFKYCSFGPIFATIFLIIFLPFFFIFFSIQPYKRLAIIDSIKRILVIYNKALIPCCKLEPKTFSLNNIKKIIIFITWKIDENCEFNKLFFMNCDLISTDEIKESLFANVDYDANKLNEYLAFFKKYFDTEFKPADNGKNPNFSNEDENNYDTNPSIN